MRRLLCRTDPTRYRKVVLTSFSLRRTGGKEMGGRSRRQAAGFTFTCCLLLPPSPDQGVGVGLAIGTSSKIKRPFLTTPNFTWTLISFVGPSVPMVAAKFPTPPVTPSPTEALSLEGLITNALSIPPPLGESGPVPGAAPTLKSSSTVPLTLRAVPPPSTTTSAVEFNALRIAVKLPVPQSGVEPAFLAFPVPTLVVVGAAGCGPHSVDRLSTTKRIPLIGSPELFVYLYRSVNVPIGLFAGSATVGSGM